MADVELLEQRVEAALALLAALLDHLQHGADVLLDRQAAEDRGFLRQIADAEPRAPVHRHRGDVEAVDLDRALVDRHQAGDHVETGRLAGAVGAEQADGLAGAHAERDAADDLAALVALGQAAGDQRSLELRRVDCDRGRRRACRRPARTGAPSATSRLGHQASAAPDCGGVMRHDDRAFAAAVDLRLRRVFICTVSLQPTSTLGPSRQHDLLAGQDQHFASSCRTCRCRRSRPGRSDLM